MPSSRLKLKRKAPKTGEKEGNSLPKRKVLSVMDHSATNTKHVVVEKQNEIHNIDASINRVHKSNFAVPKFLFATMPLSAPSLKKQKRFRNSNYPRNNMYSNNNRDESIKHQKLHSKSTYMIRRKVGKFTKETLLYEMNAEPWTALRWPNIKSLLSNKTMLNTAGLHQRSVAAEPSSLSTRRLTPHLKRSCLDDKGFLINNYTDGWESIFGSNRPTPVLVWSKLEQQLNKDSRNKNSDLNQIYNNHVNKNKNNTIFVGESSTISSRSGDTNDRDKQNCCDKTYLYKRAPLIQKRSQKR